MPQLVRSNKSSRMGRRRRHTSEAHAKVDARVRRLSRPDHNRSAHAKRRDGRVVQFGEANGQVGRERCYSASDQRRD